jgi:hypothetical protein
MALNSFFSLAGKTALITGIRGLTADRRALGDHEPIDYLLPERPVISRPRAIT